MPEVGALRRRKDNIFADLGFPNPDLQQRKVQIIGRINDIAVAHHWNDDYVSALLGMELEVFEDMADGVVSEIEIEELHRYLLVIEAHAASVSTPKQLEPGYAYGSYSERSCLPLAANSIGSSGSKVQFE